MKDLFSKKNTLLAALLLLILMAMPLWATSVMSQGPEEEAPVGSAEEERVAAPSSASAPIFSYQGQLLDGNGEPISNAAMPMTFKLYTTATDGTACWIENHTAGNAINVSDGLFHVLLGQITAIDSACLTNDAYLELVVNNETLSPRELLTSVAHAVEAGTVTAGASTLGDFYVNGKLGIGTTNPSQLLQLSSTFTFHDGGDKIIGLGYSPWPASALMNGKPAEIRWDPPTGGIMFGTDATSRTAGETTNISTRMTIAADGKVGIGTTSPTEKLHVAGNAFVGGNLVVDGPDLIMHHSARGDGGRALVHDGNDRLIINYNNDFAGDVAVASDVAVWGNLSVNGSCTLSPISSLSDHEGTVSAYNQTDETCQAGSITSGAYIEANLQTAEERQAGGNKGFSEGDVLCWGEERLELCETPNDPLVQGVADAKGNPIVLGAEAIKVIGKIKKGDYLVASNVPGYAMATDTPTFGIVIAQALEDFEGERGLIKAMIRKM